MEVENAASANFREAMYDDLTELHQDIDKSVMIYVPEPGGLASLVAGLVALAGLAQIRARSLPVVRTISH
jgi:hypothetical protein